MKRILIFGNPHSGTSILKSIIGHIDSVHEIYYEANEIEHQEYEKDYVVCKWPYVEEEFFGEKYREYIKIFIARNPAWVFSSYNRRFGSANLPEQYTLNTYIDGLKKFIEFRDNPVKDFYTIRYEDIFPDNYKQLMTLLDSIGLVYNDSIFDNTERNNLISPGVYIKDINHIPHPVSEHDKLRTYQINQPFINNNTTDKLNSLSSEQLRILVEHPVVRELYGCVI